jgi:hypothetical protein
LCSSTFHVRWSGGWRFLGHLSRKLLIFFGRKFAVLFGGPGFTKGFGFCVVGFGLTFVDVFAFLLSFVT